MLGDTNFIFAMWEDELEETSSYSTTSFTSKEDNESSASGQCHGSPSYIVPQGILCSIEVHPNLISCCKDDQFDLGYARYVAWMNMGFMKKLKGIPMWNFWMLEHVGIISSNVYLSLIMAL